MLIEIRGVYDGWSIAEMKDGTLVNRWDEDDPRYLPTEDFMDGMEMDRAEVAAWEAAGDICMRCDEHIEFGYSRCAGCQSDWEEERS